MAMETITTEQAAIMTTEQKAAITAEQEDAIRQLPRSWQRLVQITFEKKIKITIKDILGIWEYCYIVSGSNRLVIICIVTICFNTNFIARRP
jgi:adenylate kinase